ncbi:MAG: lysoplasmalogenase [Anaerolineales bacterium]
MSTSTAQLALATVALAIGIAATWAQARAKRNLHYVTKPLATTLILVLAATRAIESPVSGWWIVAGLALSLGGDVLLMLPDRFVPGLGSFLLAQVCYIVAFTIAAPILGPLWTLVPSLLLLVVLVLTVLPKTGALRWPVLGYALVITAMAWRATTRYVALAEPNALLSLLGAWLFCASDLSLAWNRFVRQAAWLPIFCLSSYYLAQVLIALSI